MTDRPDSTWTDADAEVARRLRATMARRAADMPPAGPMPGLVLLDRPEPAGGEPAEPRPAVAPPVVELPPPLPAAGGGEAGRRLAPQRRRALAVAAAVLAVGGLAAAVTAAGGGTEPAGVADAPGQAPTTVPGGLPTTTTVPGDVPTTIPGGAGRQVIGVYGRGVEGESVAVTFEAGNGDVDLTEVLGEGWEPVEAGPHRGYLSEAEGSSMVWLTMGDGIVRIESGTVSLDDLVAFAEAVTPGDDGRYTLTPPDGWRLDEELTGGHGDAGAPTTTTTLVGPATTTTVGAGTTATTLAPATTTTAAAGD